MRPIFSIGIDRSRRLRFRPWLGAIVLGLFLALGLSITISLAQGTGLVLFTGDFDPISVEPAAPGETSITAPGLPSAGALVYPDFVLLEAQARAKLERGLKARQALSPYQGNVEFSQYVTRFDYEAGWTRDYTGTTPYSETLTLQGLIDLADQDLRSARDLYGYLSVYAPEHRFRADSTYITSTLPGYTAPLCGATNKEDPDPADPAHSGLVLDPVIDWCDFQARLRQSVREDAYLRMIFGQQFMADALGLQFSGTTLLGAENAVRQEAARLRAAKYQYELAERALNEALDRNLGSGCYVSDFFTQSEWSLLSRATEGQETASHHLAVRQSYLDVPQQPTGPQQKRTEAVNSLRATSTDGYVKLIGLAALGAGRPTHTSCARGQRPDGQLAAEMAVNLAETRRKAHEMSDGRNIFGFDVTFTPARFYKSSVPQTCDTASEANRGLWDEAWCAAQLAQQLQDAEAAATREYNESQSALRTEVQNIQNGIDADIRAKSGCGPGEWTCVDTQIAKLNTCLKVVTSTEMTAASPFDTCINDAAINDKGARRALLDLRAVYVQYNSIQTKANDINERIKVSDSRNVTVTKWLGLKGHAETVARISAATLSAISCLKPLPKDGAAAIGTALVINAGCGVQGLFNQSNQGDAGALSTQASIEMANADQYKEIQNLLLNQSELLIDAYGASQQFASKNSAYVSLLNSLRSDVIEAQRQRAYFQHSPANDPSYRIVRDSTRLQFAKQLAYASQVAYLAARRAEYEYAARLNASNVRFSDVYRARTAADLTTFLNNLRGVTDGLPGGSTNQITAKDVTLSVARDVLGYTDAYFIKQGITTTVAISTERARLFRQWVAANTITNTFEAPYDGKPVLKFKFATALNDGGTWANLIPQGYDGYWLIKLAGVGTPKATNNGLSVNVLTDQSGMSYRATRITHGGQLQLRSFAGCIFDYRLIAPSMLLGQEWPTNQLPDVATESFYANVNQTHSYIDPGFRAEAFLGRGASATDWEVMVFAAAPAYGLSDMDLQRLTDIELKLSITHASRTPGTPNPSDCTRIDW